MFLKFFFSALVCVLGCLSPSSYSYTGAYYPNYQEHLHLDDMARALIAPHLIPFDHPMKPILDGIFSHSRATESETTLLKAGFEIVAKRPYSFAIIARHPAVPGYLFKLYLDSEGGTRKEQPNWKWLYQRCVGAKKIKEIIEKNNLRHFSVPDKWLYVLPQYPVSRELRPQPVVLIETYMELENEEVSRLAWKTLAKPKHLDELYIILKEGWGTVHLDPNVPYLKNGGFVFIDTEYPKRNHKLSMVKDYFSRDMKRYWDKLIN